MLRPRDASANRAWACVPWRITRCSSSVGRVTTTARGGVRESMTNLRSGALRLGAFFEGARPRHGQLGEERPKRVAAEVQVVDALELAGELACGERREHGGRHTFLDLHPGALLLDLCAFDQPDRFGLTVGERPRPRGLALGRY